MTNLQSETLPPIGHGYTIPAGSCDELLDLVPRVLTAAEWTTIKRGLARRIRALNAFVDDVYHAHEIVRAGIVPWSLIVSRPSFARAVHAVRPTSRSATAATTPTCRRSRRLPGRCQRQAERQRHHDAPVGNRPGVARAFLTGA